MTQFASHFSRVKMTCYVVLSQLSVCILFMLYFMPNNSGDKVFYLKVKFTLYPRYSKPRLNCNLSNCDWLINCISIARHAQHACWFRLCNIDAIEGVHCMGFNVFPPMNRISHCGTLYTSTCDLSQHFFCLYLLVLSY
jgi:hypothetical protein